MWIGLCLASLLVVCAQTNDSLKSALNAVHRRQRDLASYYPRPYVLGNGQPEDIGYGYQKSVAPSTYGVFETGVIPPGQLGTHDGLDVGALEKLIVDYLEVEDDDDRAVKRSVFRENSNYPEALQALYDEKEETPSSPFRERFGPKSRLRNAHALLRSYAGLGEDRYPREGDSLDILNSVWEKYKGEDPEALDESDVKNLFEYLYPEEKKRQHYDNYDFFNSPLAWAKREDQVGARRMAQLERMMEEGAFDERYRPVEKRYPIAKRSTAKHIKPFKTDPKVAQELSDIFSKENASKSVSTTHAPPKNSSGQKEVTVSNSLDKPLDIKKKSVNWSEYFGVDRRKKKSSRPAVDDSWLLDKYMEAYGRGEGYDKPKREDMDAKLRAMEDLIVDQAIKYTGAHEGVTDPREIRLIKDKVMSQLAAAYSLEKMRRALSEFRSSIAVQQANSAAPSRGLPQQSISGKNADDKEEKKKSPLPKPDKKDAPKEISNQINTNTYEDFDREEECPVLDDIEERCSVASGIVLDKEKIFLPLCMLHQICYLCGAENGAATPRGCDATFLSESVSVCRGDAPCRLTARRTLDALRSFKNEPSPLGCDFVAHPCLARFLAKRR